MTTPTDEELVTIDGWPGGVNNRVRETEQVILRDGVAIPSSLFLRRALNVDLTAEGHPLRRPGYTLHTGGYAHSLYGCDRLGVFCAVIDGQLLAGNSPDSLQVIAEVNRYNPMSYTWVNDTIFYSNGQLLGEISYDIQSRPWGIPVAPQPAVSGAAAEKAEGWSETLQVSATYVDYYGREGGASEPVLVGADASFTVTLPMPLPTDVAEARIYVSQPNSEILYHAETMLTLPTVTIYPQNLGKGKELDTLNLFPPRAGQLVTSMNGRVYIARDDVVSFTEPLRYHLTRPSSGIYLFPDYVTLLQASTDCVYVGTRHGMVCLLGSDPYNVEQRHVSPYAPVEGSAARIPGARLGLSEIDELPVWWDKDGVLVVGLPGGQLKQLTRDRLAVPEFGRGAVSLREREGMSHIVSALRSSDGLNRMGATDSVVASVRRNDIVLNT